MQNTTMIVIETTSDTLALQDRQDNIPWASHAFHEERQQLQKHTKLLAWGFKNIAHRLLSSW